MATHQSGVILIICSGFALLRSTQSQLNRTDNSCDGIICPGGDVQYDCSVPINSTSVVWTMIPECERINGEKPDIDFVFRDPPLSIVCTDGRKITVQGMTTSNGDHLVSTLNVTNITSSQLTTECLLDDREVKTVGSNRVYTTAPVPSVINIDVTMDLVLITLDQLSLIENCTLIDYTVSSSTECGMCGRVVDNSISCTNAQVGAGCTVTIETTLCRMLEYVYPINVTTMAPQLLITTGSNTPSNTQAGSLSSGVIAVIVVILLAVVIVVIVGIVVICIIVYVKGKDTSYGIFRKRTKPVVQGLIEEQMEMEDQAAFNIQSQPEHEDQNLHGEHIATGTIASITDTRTTRVTETGDNGQQYHDRGDSEEVNEHQNNIGELCYQSNDERDSMEPQCDDQTTLLEVHGHDKDNERHSEHQNISGRNAVEQVTEVEENGHQGDDGDAVQNDDDEISSENLEVFDAVPVEESEKSTAQVTEADETREKQPTSELLVQGPRLSLASPTRRSTDSVDTHPLPISNDTEATQSGNKSNGNHPLQVDDGESSLNGGNPPTLVGLRNDTPITQPHTYKGNRANIMLSERHGVSSVSRSTETQMFSNPLGEEDHNPAQRETGDCKGLRFHMDTNQFFESVKKEIRNEAEKTRVEMKEEISRLERKISIKNKTIQDLDERVKALEEEGYIKTAEIEKQKNDIENLLKKQAELERKCESLEQEKQEELERKCESFKQQKEAEIEELKRKLAETKTEYEAKIEVIKNEKDQVIQEKNEEIARLKQQKATENEKD